MKNQIIVTNAMGEREETLGTFDTPQQAWDTAQEDWNKRGLDISYWSYYFYNARTKAEIDMVSLIDNGIVAA